MLSDARPDSVTDKEAERYRQLTGVFRVGQLEKGTLLATDSVFELIVLFDRHPRLDAVQRLVDHLSSSKLFVKQETESLVGFDRDLVKMVVPQDLVTNPVVTINYEQNITFRLSFSTLADQETDSEPGTQEVCQRYPFSPFRIISMLVT